MDMYAANDGFQRLEGVSPFEETSQIQGVNPVLEYGQMQEFSQNPGYGQMQGVNQNPEYGQMQGFSQNPEYGQVQEGSQLQGVSQIQQAGNFADAVYPGTDMESVWTGNGGETESLPIGAYQEAFTVPVWNGNAGAFENLPVEAYPETSAVPVWNGNGVEMETLPVGAYQGNAAEPAMYESNGEMESGNLQEPMQEEYAGEESLPVADVPMPVQDMEVPETAGQENMDEQDMDDPDEEQEEQSDEDEDDCEDEQDTEAEESENSHAFDEFAGMSDEEIVAESMKRISAATEKITGRNMKECVAEYVQTLCLDDVGFARLTMKPKKSMLNCFQYINRKAWNYIQNEMKANGITPGTNRQVYGSDVPDELCYQWAEDYFRDPSAEEDEDVSSAKPYAVQTSKAAAGKKTEKSGQKSFGKKSVGKKKPETKASEKKAPEQKPGAETQADKKEEGKQLSLFDMMGEKAS